MGHSRTATPAQPVSLIWAPGLDSPGLQSLVAANQLRGFPPKLCRGASSHPALFSQEGQVPWLLGLHVSRGFRTLWNLPGALDATPKPHAVKQPLSYVLFMKFTSVYYLDVVILFLRIGVSHNPSSQTHEQKLRGTPIIFCFWAPKTIPWDPSDAGKAQVAEQF